METEVSKVANSRKQLVSAVAKKAKISDEQAEVVVNETIAEMVSPFVLQRPGSEVALLDNSCRNNCKEPSLIGSEVINPAAGGRIG